MKRIFSTQDAVDFLEKVNCYDAKVLMEHDNGVVDFEIKHRDRNGNFLTFYAYASNYSMSAYNRLGVVYNLSTVWQDHLCENVKGYPEMLVKYLEKQMDNDEFRHKKKQKLSYSILEEEEYERQVKENLARIDKIKSTYIKDNTKPL